MSQKTVDVASDFSRFPAGRIRSDGRFSAQAFREDVLVPALSGQGSVTVVMDGAAGYGPSFLEEAFGGLIRNHNFSESDLRSRLRIETSVTYRENMIWDYISEAETSRKIQ